MGGSPPGPRLLVRWSTAFCGPASHRLPISDAVSGGAARRHSCCRRQKAGGEASCIGRRQARQQREGRCTARPLPARTGPTGHIKIGRDPHRGGGRRSKKSLCSSPAPIRRRGCPRLTALTWGCGKKGRPSLGRPSAARGETGTRNKGAVSSTPLPFSARCCVRSVLGCLCSRLVRRVTFWLCLVCFFVFCFFFVLVFRRPAEVSHSTPSDVVDFRQSRSETAPGSARGRAAATANKRQLPRKLQDWAIHPGAGSGHIKTGRVKAQDRGLIAQAAMEIVSRFEGRPGHRAGCSWWGGIRGSDWYDRNALSPKGGWRIWRKRGETGTGG